MVNFPAHHLVNDIKSHQRPVAQTLTGPEMNFNLLQPDDKEHLNRHGQRTIQRLHGLSWLAGSGKVCLLECLLGLILRNRKRHLEAARWHTDLIHKREKQADHIGMMAAAVLARATDGNDETP
jgi:hypothetical protein